uniref:Ammonium transporter AmtB-like domain-containing protein n=1 Tax=Ditylenchus dipsaci TaxID=166011 RepID=A0A915D058_9BILA
KLELYAEKLHQHSAKNLLDSLITIIGYWSIGWAFAYGDNSLGWLSPFVGGSEFFGIGVTAHSTFFFQYVFAARASTIISGAVAERCEFATFIVYSIVVSSTFDQYSVTYLDTAGSGVVHLCGGTIGLVAACMMGPRIGRFTDHSKGKRKLSLMYGKIKGHSVPFASLDISKHGSGQAVARAMINTIMCGAFSAITYLLIHYVRKGKWTVLLTINACLTGMISACAGCNLISPWTTIFTGGGAGLIIWPVSTTLKTPN